MTSLPDEIRKQRTDDARIHRELIEDLREFLNDRAHIAYDTWNGQPAPNEAMRLLERLNAIYPEE